VNIDGEEYEKMMKKNSETIVDERRIEECEPTLQSEKHP
jgi:hypothetical protein